MDTLVKNIVVSIAVVLSLVFSLTLARKATACIQLFVPKVDPNKLQLLLEVVTIVAWVLAGVLLFDSLKANLF